MLALWIGIGISEAQIDPPYCTELCQTGTPEYHEPTASGPCGGGKYNDDLMATICMQTCNLVGDVGGEGYWTDGGTCLENNLEPTNETCNDLTGPEDVFLYMANCDPVPLMKVPTCPCDIIESDQPSRQEQVADCEGIVCQPNGGGGT
jgi:hypothetical protein